MPVRSFRGFSSRFMKETDRAIEPVSFLPSSTQAAPMETITVQDIDGSPSLTLVSILQVTNGKLTAGIPNTCAIANGTPIQGLKTFLNGGFS